MIDDPRSIASEQRGYWTARGITAAEAWEALTEERREDVTWDQVEQFMVGWAVGQREPAAELRQAA